MTASLIKLEVVTWTKMESQLVSISGIKNTMNNTATITVHMKVHLNPLVIPQLLTTSNMVVVMAQFQKINSISTCGFDH